MDLFKAIEKRHSTRKFSEKFPDRKILEWISKLAYKIPSAGALYPIVLFTHYFDKPPVYFVICADFKKTTVKYGIRGIYYVFMEAGHTAQNICLACEALGLGSCCIGAFNEVEIKGQIKEQIKFEFDPIYMVAVGYPVKEKIMQLE